MSDLRNKLIRLAHERPELRGQLLPLIKEASVKTAASVESLLQQAERIVASLYKESMRLQRDPIRSMLTMHINEATEQLMYASEQWGKYKKAMGKTAKNKTFLQARAEVLAELENNRWKVSNPSMKVPHATKEDGKVRFYFKAQSVYMSCCTGPHSLRDAQSTHVNVKTPGAAKKLMDLADKETSSTNPTYDWY